MLACISDTTIENLAGMGLAAVFLVCAAWAFVAYVR